MSSNKIAYSSLMDGTFFISVLITMNVSLKALMKLIYFLFYFKDIIVEDGIELDLHAYACLTWGLSQGGELQSSNQSLILGSIHT